VAIMSTGYGEGENRVLNAFADALHSPLLNNNEVDKSKRLLFYIYYGNDELMTYELDEVDKFTEQFDKDVVDVIWGMGQEVELGSQVKVTLLASGFDISNVSDTGKSTNGISDRESDGKIDFVKKTDSDSAGITTSIHDDNKIKKWYIRSSEPAILTIEQMNDDELIAQMELVPSCQRNAKTAAKNIIQAKKLQAQLSSTSPKQEDDGVIRFTS